MDEPIRFQSEIKVDLKSWGSESSTIPDFNVVLFGAAGVGKSALVRRFLKNSFSEMYLPTVEETYTTVLQTMSCTCVRLVLIDTAGLHPFPAMRELRMRTGSAFVFVFSYDSADSLQEAIRLHSDLQRAKDKFLCKTRDKFDPKSVIFVGNKADLLTVPAIIEYGNEDMEREDSESSRRSSGNESVSMTSSIASAAISAADDEIQRTARSTIEHLGCPLIDTSARLGSNVLEVFHSVLWPMLFAHSNLIGKVTPADIANGRFREDSPIRGPQENEAIYKKISWPRRNPSEHSITFPFDPNLSPSSNRSPNRSRFHLERRRKISCVENDMFTGGSNNLFIAREEVNRKFSVGSRLLVSSHAHNNRYPENKSNNFLSVVDDPYNRPASRSQSVDNSLTEKRNSFRDTNSTDSAYSERSYSSLSSVEKENVWKLSVSSADARCRHGRFLSPSPRRSSRDCDLAMDLCLHSLEFVQEVGHYLDPSHKSEDISEPRVPCFQTLNFGRRGKSPQPSLNRERVKRRSVFSQSNFCLVDQICEANEPSSPRSEHEFNLVVPEAHRRVFSQRSSKSNNCKIS